MIDKLPAEIKELTNWLTTFAFIGWSLTEGDYSLEELTDISEKGGSRYIALVAQFNAARLKAMTEAQNETDKC